MRLFLFVLFAPLVLAAQVYPPGDSLRSPSYVAREAALVPRYPFVRYARNVVQWNAPGALDPLFSALSRADSQRVTILHIGDSHVQADIYPHQARTRLQQIFGPGGRGMVFPYSAARTHPGADYITYHHGAWAYAKNIHPQPILPLGLTGYTVHTRDPRAGVKLAFTEASSLAGNTRLRIWLERHPSAYDLRVHYGAEAPLILKPSADTALPYVEALLPFAPTDLHLTLQQPVDSSATTQAERLELYGISLDIPTNRGVLYHSVGVNGATFDAILRQELMDEQVAALAPDLILLDISGNEYYGRPFDPIDFDTKLRLTVQRLRRAAPRAAVIVSCSQDIYRRYWNVAATEPASAVARQAAFELGCGFYDYFAVSGGRFAMLQWREAGLAKRDRVHLTNDGYRLKGDLLTSALLTSYRAWLGGAQVLTDTSADLPQMFTDADSATPARAPRVGEPVPMSLRARPRPATPPPGSVAPKGRPTIHVVQGGEVLGTIAQRYRVGVSAIRYWNNLRSSMIFAGQKLVIYTPLTSSTRPPAAVKSAAKTDSKPAAPPATKPAGATRRHTVGEGESLWTIAQKYKSTVARLKQLNGLTRDALRPGQKLWVP